MTQNDEQTGTPRSLPDFIYDDKRKRATEIFLRIVQRISEWFPVNSLDYWVDGTGGMVRLVSGKDEYGRDQRLELGITITASEEDINHPPNEQMPFVRISLPTGSVKFNSLKELDSSLLDSRDQFVRVMMEHRAPITVPWNQHVGDKSKLMSNKRIHSSSEPGRH